jgi:hypothetical protein
MKESKRNPYEAITVRKDCNSKIKEFRIPAVIKQQM